MDYPLENWRKFGRLVYVNRTKKGYADTKEWSAVVGRSSRVLLGLERGEPVGRGTLVKIAEALRWESEDPWKLLSDPEFWDQPESSRLKDEETGQVPALWLQMVVPPTELASYEDLELIGELARRAKRAKFVSGSRADLRRVRESLIEAMGEVPPVPDDVAARDEGGPSMGEKLRHSQDQDAQVGDPGTSDGAN